MKDTNRIPLKNKYEVGGLHSSGELKYVNLPNTGGVPNGIKDITHPSVYYNPAGWNGHTHWMAVTPYPTTLAETGEFYENPCIYYADSTPENKHPLIWTPIANNPIYPKPILLGYNSDPDIFMANNKLWVVQRRRGKEFEGDGSLNTNFTLQSSSDGLNWSPAVDIYRSNLATNDVCPMYQYEGGKHKIFIIQGYRNPDNVNDNSRTECLTIIESTSLETPNFVDGGWCSLEGLPNAWHGGLFMYKGERYMICGGSHDGHRTNTRGVILAKQIAGTKDFIFYDKPIIQPYGAYRVYGYVDELDNLVLYLSSHDKGTLEVIAPTQLANHPAGNFVSKFETNMTNLLRDLEKYKVESV